MWISQEIKTVNIEKSLVEACPWNDLYTKDNNANQVNNIVGSFDRENTLRKFTGENEYPTKRFENELFNIGHVR